MEYYAFIKRNDILIHATMWMNLEELCEVKKNYIPKRPHIVWVHLYEIYKE